MMIKKPLLAFILLLTSTTLSAQTSPANCPHPNEAITGDAETYINVCSTVALDGLHTELHSTSNEMLDTPGFPFHVSKHESSVAEVILVVLLIPWLIILLFSRFTKSAK
jgi:hypothetical protein